MNFLGEVQKSAGQKSMDTGAIRRVDTEFFSRGCIQGFRILYRGYMIYAGPH